MLFLKAVGPEGQALDSEANGFSWPRDTRWIVFEADASQPICFCSECAPSYNVMHVGDLQSANAYIFKYALRRSNALAPFGISQ